MQLPPENNVPCWHCSQYFGEVARTALTYIFCHATGSCEMYCKYRSACPCVHRSRCKVLYEHDHRFIVGVACETDGDDNSDDGSDDYNDWRWMVIQFVSYLLTG